MEHHSVSRSPARLAFVCYLRTGIRLPDSAFEPVAAALEAKFNPYHDPENGRFTFGPGGLPKSASYTGIKVNGTGVIKPVGGGNLDHTGKLIPEQFPPDPYALSNPAAALEHYIGGTGEDRNYYFNNVDTSKVRLSDFPGLANLANNAKPGSYPIVFASGKYNGDFLGINDASSWATVGGLKLRASGVLVVTKSGQYHFNGNISAGTDTYDFDRRAGRSLAASTMTAVGRLIPGKSFRIHLIGSKPFRANGRR